MTIEKSKKYQMKTGHTKKCLKLGAQALTDEELLAVLLRSGSSGSSSLELAGEGAAPLPGQRGPSRPSPTELQQLKVYGELEQ